MHMAYLQYAETTNRLNPSRVVTCWNVVLSGFFDSIGVYETVTAEHEAIASAWVISLGLQDLVRVPGRSNTRELQGSDSFCNLSHGQQRLVLLCRAVVKTPRLLLFDEPTHGLSAFWRKRFLKILALLASAPDVAIVMVTHREEEIEALKFEHILNLQSC